MCECMCDCYCYVVKTDSGVLSENCVKKPADSSTDLESPMMIETALETPAADEIPQV